MVDLVIQYKQINMVNLVLQEQASEYLSYLSSPEPKL